MTNKVKELIFSLVSWFAGKKTFFAAGIMVILSGLKAQGYLDEGTFQLLLGVAASLGLAALRLGINSRTAELRGELMAAVKLAKGK